MLGIRLDGINITPESRGHEICTSLERWGGGRVRNLFWVLYTTHQKVTHDFHYTLIVTNVNVNLDFELLVYP